MDKVEYKIRADEISALIGEGRYAEAVKLADTIDWKRVKSVTMLCRISDLYKINRRFEESRDVLLMAYEKQPTRRAIVYSLCELAIKMGEFVQAVEYYKEFVRIAPRDTGRYILQYKLYEAQEVSLEERIAVLEELKQHDYRERWAYELAYLYHRVGLTTECIEECDEIFLWFGEGRYVMKALELKMLHEPLSPEQQDRYNRYKQKNMGYVDSSIVNEHDEVGKDENAQGVVEQIKQPTKEIPPITDEVIQAYNAGVSLPEPEATKEIISGEINAAVAEPEPVLAYEQATDYEPATAYEQAIDYVPATANEQPAEYDTSAYSEPLPEQEPANYNNEFTAEPEPIPEPVPAEDGIVYPHISEIKEPSVDVSAYNTMNLQETLAEGLKEIIGSDGYEGAGDDARVYTPVSDMTEITAEHQPLSDTEEFIAEFDKEDSVAEDEQETQELSQPAESMQEVFFDTQTVEIPTAPQLGIDIKYGGNGPILGEEKPAFGVGVYEEKPLEDEVPGAVIHPNASYQMPSHFESILSQESDGQISLAVQPEPEVEKQITGQISISEYMLNWEQFKKEQQAKQLQEVKKRVADETGDMFADFDESSKTGLQEKLEKAISDALKQERHDKASGRGDWSVKKEDVINAAVAKVMGDDAVYDEPEDYEDSEFDEPEYEEAGYKESEYEAEEAEEPADAEPEIEESAEREDDDLSSEDSSKSDYSFKEVEDEEPVATIRTTELPVQEIKKIFKEVVTETLDTVAVRALEAERAANAEEHNTIDEEITEAMNSKESESEYTVEADSEASEDSKSDESSSKASSSDSVEEDKATDQKVSDAKESDADSQKGKGGKDSKEEKKRHHIGNREIEERVRTMTPEEKELFGPYIHHKKSRRQIINAIDNLSMDAFTGNAIVTGEEGAGTVNLAKGLIKAVQASDSNFSGKVAKITANTLNKKSTASIFERLANGALIIQRAADLESETVNELLGILQEENKGLIIVMEDTRDDMDKFLDKNPSLRQSFNVRVDIEALDDDSLVAYAKQYAFEREYAIDNLGILALHTRISERQTLDHEVTVAEVKDIIDDAIYYAEKRTVAHFMDVIVRKRYDENDMVILREKDFMH